MMLLRHNNEAPTTRSITSMGVGRRRHTFFSTKPSASTKDGCDCSNRIKNPGQSKQHSHNINNITHPSSCIIWIGVLIASWPSLVASAAGESYYQKYPKYPPYCADPKEMQQRAIPSIPHDATDRFLQHQRRKRQLQEEAKDDNDDNITNSTIGAGDEGSSIRNSTTTVPSNDENADAVENAATSATGSSSGSTHNSQLIHVTAIIRHGARTPTHAHPCWKGYWEIPQGIWDCSLKTMLVTRPYQYEYDNEEEEEENGSDAGNSMFLIQKVYDAFEGEGIYSPYRNNLNGTCQAAQLTTPGYDQQITNGQILRNAYVNDGRTAAKKQDERLLLFDTALMPYPFQEEFLRFRSDDDQRTLASGQILLSSLFEPELHAYIKAKGVQPIISHHTADRHKDIMPPKKVCPSQRTTKEQALASQEYQDFIHSQESQTMQRMILEHQLAEESLLDCLMTTICTDRSLPDFLNDYGRNESSSNNNHHQSNNKQEDQKYDHLYGENRFERLVNFVIQNRTIVNRYNDAQWSKTVMGPFWAEILEHLPVLSSSDTSNLTTTTTTSTTLDKTRAPKLALYSGHDSTISPLMASLSTALWNATNFPWYASMMIIEIHEIYSDDDQHDDKDYAFRLVYNGQALTWLISGCPEYSHFCHVSVLIDRVSKFATRRNGGCGVDDGSSHKDSSHSNGQSTDLGQPPTSLPSSSSVGTLARVEDSATQHPIMTLILSMMASFLFCSFMTFVTVKCCRCYDQRKKQRGHPSERLSSDTAEGCMVEEPDVVID